MPPFLRTVLLATMCITFGAVGGGCDGSSIEGDTQPPPAPVNLAGTSQDAAVALSWPAVNADDLSGYNVYRDTAPIDEPSGLNPHNESPVSETAYTDGDANNGTSYYYVVTAVDEAGNESAPSDSIKKTPFAAPPDHPETSSADQALGTAP